MHIPVNRVFNNVSRNLGLKEYTEHIDSWAEWAFEAEQYIGSKETFLQSEITYNADVSSSFPSATIVYESNPSRLANLVINGVKFYFRDTDHTNFIAGNLEDYIIPIKSTLDLTMAGLVTHLKTSYYHSIEGISPSWDSTSKTLTLLYADKGDAGNNILLETDVSGRITKQFSGGKEILQNKQIVLPSNLVKLTSVRAGDTILSPTSSQFKSKVSNLIHRYYVNGNRLNFSVDYTVDVVISYLSVPMSEEGYPMVKQGHEEAIAFYIMWKHKSIGYYAGEVPQYIVKDLERRWYQLCGKVRGDDNMPNSTELLKIGKIWNSKIPITSSNPPFYDGLNSY